MPFTDQLRRLAHNKWALAGVVAAAGLGGVVLYRNRGKSAAGTSDATTGAAGSNGVATLDTSGTDLASYLGQYQASLQSTLDQYSSQLSDAITALNNMQTNGSTGGTGTTITPPPWLHPRRPGVGVLLGKPTPPRRTPVPFPIPRRRR